MWLANIDLNSFFKKCDQVLERGLFSSNTLVTGTVRSIKLQVCHLHYFISIIYDDCIKLFKDRYKQDVSK